MCAAKEALGGGCAVGATDVIVVHGGERRELAVAQAMATLVMQGQLSITALHPGTAALEAIGAFAGHLFQARSLGARQGLERMVAVTQRFEQRAAQRAQSVTRLGEGAARGDALQIQGRNRLFDEGALQLGGQHEGLDLQRQGGEEKGEGGQQLGSQTLRFGQALTGARRQLRGLGDTPEPRPDAVEALRDLFDGLCLSALRSYGGYRMPCSRTRSRASH